MLRTSDYSSTPDLAQGQRYFRGYFLLCCDVILTLQGKQALSGMTSGNTQAAAAIAGPLSKVMAPIFALTRITSLAAESPFEYVFRQRVLDLRLDGPLQRSCAIHRIKAGFSNDLQRSIADFEFHLHLGQTFFEILQLDPCNRLDVFFTQRMEHHDFNRCG